MDTQTQSVQNQIVDLILKSQKILIMASSPADGDCIGSSLSLYLALRKLNKEVTVVCPDPIPDVYHFLPITHVIGDRVVASKDFIITIDTKKIQSAQVKSIVEDGKINIIIMPENGRLSEQDVGFNYGPERYDIIITVDTGGLEQLGQLYANNVEMFNQMPVINIDHHFSNDHFGRLNLVDVMASATTELLIPIVSLLEEKSGVPMWDEDIATLLLTGIITDTGSFQNSNTTPRAFDASAQLISYGARQQEIIQHIFKTKQLTTLKLWGRILTKMQTDETSHIVWSTLTQKDFADTGAAENETGGIIDELLSNAPGAEIICLLKEKKDGIISGSIRTTNPSVDASALAESFGGGGHTRAAGFKITGLSLEKVEQQVLAGFRDYQSKRLGIMSESSEGEPAVTITQPPIVMPIVPPPAPKPVVVEPTPMPAIVEPAPVPAPTLPVIPKLELKLEPKPEPAVVPAPTPEIKIEPAVEPTPIVAPEPVVAPPAPEPIPARAETPPAPAPIIVEPPAPVPAPQSVPTPVPAPTMPAQQPGPLSGFNFQQPVDAAAPLAGATPVDEEPKPQAPYNFGA